MVAETAAFHLHVRKVQAAEERVRDAKADLNLFVEQLRVYCPHLRIAASEVGGRHTRVCQHCGIQEIAWYSDFTTLTIPGGTWYETLHDKSRDRRKGEPPVIFPMAAHELYAYRRGSHLDVSEN